MDKMEGSDEASDIIVVGEMQHAVERLAASIPAGDPSWELRGLHLGTGFAEGQTMEDCFESFLRWAQKPDDLAAGRYNITKAFRRLEAFAAFQEKHYEAFFDEPVLFEETEMMNDFWKMKVPNWNLNQGCAMWVVDLEKIESFDRSHITDRQIMRGMWGLMIASMFDRVVQTQGVILVQNLRNIGFSAMLSMQGAFKSIEATMNEMFYGVMPFKMKECIIVGSAWWMSAVLRVMRLFMSKKMSDRIKNVTQEQMLHHVGGAAMVPKGYCGGTGPLDDRYAAGNDPNALVQVGGEAAAELSWEVFDKSALRADPELLEGMLSLSEEDMVEFRVQLSQCGVPVCKRSTSGKVQPRILYVEGGDHSKLGRMIYCAEKLGKKSGDKAWPLTEIQDVRRMNAPEGCDGAWLQLVHAARTLELRVEGEEHCNGLVQRLRCYIMAETMAE